MDQKKERIESRCKTFDALVEANSLEDDEKRFTAVCAAVTEGFIQGIRDYVPKKSRSTHDNAQEQA